MICTFPSFIYAPQCVGNAYTQMRKTPLVTANLYKYYCSIDFSIAASKWRYRNGELLFWLCKLREPRRGIAGRCCRYVNDIFSMTGNFSKTVYTYVTDRVIYGYVMETFFLVIRREVIESKNFYENSPVGIKVFGGCNHMKLFFTINVMSENIFEYICFWHEECFKHYKKNNFLSCEVPYVYRRYTQRN